MKPKNVTSNSTETRGVSRRDFVRTCALGVLGVASAPVLGCHSPKAGHGRSPSGPATRTIDLDQGWRFGGELQAAAQEPGFDDANFEKITLPHCVTELSWQNWKPASWAKLWSYRRHFGLPPELRGLRAFLDFEAAMTGATPVLNGQTLPKHLGGYLPFHYEVTSALQAGENVLAVAIDGRWQSVPPEGSPRGVAAVDYLEPAGLHRSVKLRLVPPVFISDVFAKPVKVLDSDRRIDVICSLDAALMPAGAVRLEAELRRNGRRVAQATHEFRLEQTGENVARFTLSGLGNIALWHPEAPNLYEVVVTLFVNGQACHDYRRRIGFREARFEREGFFLNGKRLQIFGLDRHEIYPYVGAAMPPRVLRRDAEILRREFNCNFVRCSHYPQSEPFLDACDELGVMVWEEPPGWQFIGDEAWQDLAVRDVQSMVRRDRHHPAIVIWGVRINESANNPEFYRRTKAAAKALDDTRQTSGAMNRYSTKDWVQEVYAYDDYHAAPDGSVGVREPLPGVPYFLTEGVGQFAYGNKKGGFGRKYRRAGDLDIQQQQAIWHAQIHDRAQRNPRFCGVVAWCAFDYASLINPYNAVKCPGVADVFRIPKLGAAFYRSQVDPRYARSSSPIFIGTLDQRAPPARARKSPSSPTVTGWNCG